MKPFDTDRLSLRPATAWDAEFLVKLMNDEGYVALIGDRGVRTVEDAKEYLRSAPIYDYSSDGLGFNIVEIRDGPRVGVCGLVRRDGFDDVDLGYAILKQYSGLGYATEAAAATLGHALKGLRLRRVVAITVLENAGSQKVLERLGMHLEKTYLPEGGSRETCLYAIANAENEAVAPGQRE